jgi:DNA-binding transcriptional LysR family regulator
LTVQIRQLEQALGIALFDRNKRQVALTQAGRELLLPLERILIDTEAILATTRDLAAMRRGLVTIAALPSIAAGLLPVAIHQFRQDYPGVVVRLHDVVAGSVAELVKSGEVNFGIGSQLRADPDIDSEPLLTDRICAFVPQGHAFEARQRLSLSELIGHPLVVTGRNSSVRQICERAFELDALSPLIAGEANYMSTAIGMVHAGLGIALLPESAVNSGPCGDLRVIPIQNRTLTRHIEVMLPKGRSASVAARALIECLRKLARTTRPGNALPLPTSSPPQQERGSRQHLGDRSRKAPLKRV